jgi:hypothetical protein
MDQPAEIQRDGSARPFDILFNTNVSSREPHIFSDHEMFPLLVRDPEAANLYQIGKTKSEKLKKCLPFTGRKSASKQSSITDSNEPTELTNSSLSELVFLFGERPSRIPKTMAPTISQL